MFHLLRTEAVLSALPASLLQLQSCSSVCPAANQLIRIQQQDFVLLRTSIRPSIGRTKSGNSELSRIQDFSNLHLC